MQTSRDSAALYDPNVVAISASHACRILGIAKSTGQAAYNETGQLCEGVPVITVGRRKIISTRHLRAVLGIPEPEGDK